MIENNFMITKEDGEGGRGEVNQKFGINRYPQLHMGFPGGSDGKESTCNAEDLGLIMGWEDPLDEGMATHSTLLAQRIPTDRGASRATVHWVSKSWTTAYKIGKQGPT